MGKTFRRWDPEQRLLLPPAVEEFVPPGHLAHFVRALVSEQLDVRAILDAYQEERGYPPYHPVMMTALLLYAYCQGVYSSRRIAQACEQRLDFMAVTAMTQPDFRTISDFRKRHLAALSGLFTQVLRLCAAAGLVKLGHVALDGTKVKANASKHKAMSYGRMAAAEATLTAEVAQWLAQAAAADAQEDTAHGPAQRGDELPDWVRTKQRRLEQIRAARAALEAEAATGAPASPDQEPPAEPPPPPAPPAKAQRNFTDPDSRIMKGPDGFVQAYNGQLVVDTAHHVIVAQTVSNQPADAPHLPAMIAQLKRNTGRQAAELSADAGYCSEANLREAERRHIRAYIATGRQRHGDAAATGRRAARAGSRVAAMQTRLRRAGRRSRYRLRKQTVEPVFGVIKQARGFRQFLLRGLAQVRGEWSLLCLAHNLLKLAQVAA
jgi:transposase